MRKIRAITKMEPLGASCCGVENMEIIGSGGYDRKGKTTSAKIYDGYYCAKCKRVYIDCWSHGHHGYDRATYSPRATRRYLAKEVPE